MAQPTFSEEASNAIEALKELKEPVDYVVCGFKDGTTELDLVESGKGGVKNVRELLAADFKDKICTGAFLVTGVDDRGLVVSYRRKFVHFIWIGPEVKMMAKARVASQSGAMKGPFTGMQLYIQAFSESDLSEANLEKALLSAGAAHKPTRYDFTNTAEQEGETGNKEEVNGAEEGGEEVAEEEEEE